MKTIRLTVDLTYDESIMGDTPNDIVWLHDLLTSPSDPLWITSDEIGDTIGTIEVISIEAAEKEEEK